MENNIIYLESIVKHTSSGEKENKMFKKIYKKLLKNSISLDKDISEMEVLA